MGLSALIALAMAAMAAPAAPPAGTPLIPPATIDDRLEVTGEALAARSVRTRMTVAVAIGAQGPFRFLVDSGADRTVIGAGLAARLGLPAEGMVTLHGMAGSSEVGTVRLEGLRVGASAVRPILAPALPEQYIGAQGLLGIDALADQRLLLDFDAKTITIQDTRRPEDNGLSSEEIVVVARKRHGQLILTQASADGRPIYAVLDSGSDITLGNSALRARIFGGRHPPAATPVTLTSVTGATITADLLTLPELKLGGVTLFNVPMAFVDAPPFALFGLARDPAIMLGTDVLQSFRRVSLDFRNRKVRFVLRR